MSIVTVRGWRLVGTVTAALAGLYHIAVAASLFADTSLAAMTYGEEAVLNVPGFFLVLGAFQLVWAWDTRKEEEKTMIGIGTMGFLGSILLYLVALTTPLPFGVKQQVVSPPAIVAKIIEAAYVAGSVGLIRSLARSAVHS